MIVLTGHAGGMPPNYTYRAEWNPERLEYLSSCLEFPGHYAQAFTAHEAVAAMERTVEQLLAERAEFGQSPPKSLTDHRFSGRFMVRTSRAMHSRLMVEATEQGVSFNQWVACALAGRRPPSFDDYF